MLISVVQTHEHRVCLVNSGWTDSYKLRVTLVSQVRQLPLAYSWVVLGKNKCHHPPLILRVSVVSAFTDSNLNPREMQAIMGPAGRGTWNSRLATL